MRGRPFSTSAAADAIGTVRAPVLLSGSRISPVSKFRSVPAQTQDFVCAGTRSARRRRIAAVAWTDARRSAGATRSTSPEPVEFFASQEPLVLLDLEAGYTPGRGCFRRGRQPQASARLNILTRMSAARFATVGM